MEALLNTAEANPFDLPMIYLFQDFAKLCDNFERLQPLGQTINTFFQRLSALWEQTYDSPMRRIFSNLHRRHGSYWALQKGIIDGILLTISDTQTINGMPNYQEYLSPLNTNSFAYCPKVLDYLSLGLFSPSL